MEKFLNALIEETNYQKTENGAIGYKSTFNPIVDMNFRVPSYKKDETKLIYDFAKAFAFDAEYALRFMFFMRDVRGGLGERQSFRVLLKEMAKDSRLAPILAKNLHLVPEYGRWDDLFVLFGTSLEQDMIHCVRTQLMLDMTPNNKGDFTVSLLGKWMPSEQASSARTKAMAKLFREALGLSPRKYRKMLSALRAKIDVVERRMTAKDWDGIDYSQVPSIANLRYNSAFLRNDEERRREFLGRALEGEVKINAGAIYPYQISSQLLGGWGRCVGENVDVDSLEAQWRNLPDLMKGMEESTIVVQDGSGSMLTEVARNVTALDVAVSLAVYCAERLEGPFKNKAISFSGRPTFLDYGNYKYSMDKIKASYLYDEVSNTNIEATFDLLLNTAISHNLTNEEMVKNVLIVSDMEFDQARGFSIFWGYNREEPSSQTTLFNNIRRKYKAAGYEMPKLIFWNVNSRTNTIPEYGENSILLSGLSQNALKIALNGGGNPWEALKEVLDSPRYSAITI